ncbi:hypothetical protein NE619_03920 [Anaerovorax odorimutans]|uniref:Uncharacterized protein n=1 Tax=Anaerovorax odorimutans TaxID=109327 RepID=A0ABT1RL27_9FIRM|nr:hypothetical protein [Anaerovorax odorimutans]MCQ4635865.1 hypothetical protein [Anaerovorax odorimutans]
MRKRVLSILLACMIGLGAFFGSYEKAHAVPAAIPPLLVVGILAACGITIGSSDAVDRFMSKYKDTALFQAILDQVKADKIQIASGGVILYSISRELIDAVKSFWKEENLPIQAEFGGNIENGIWKGTAELNVDHSTYLIKKGGSYVFDSEFDSREIYKLGNVKLGHFIESNPYASTRVLIFGVFPFNGLSFDYSYTKTPFCFYSRAIGDHDINTYKMDNRYHYASVNSRTGELSGCVSTNVYIRYIGETNKSYQYEQITSCINPQYGSEEHTHTQTIDVDKTVVGESNPTTVTLDDVNKKLDELKEGQWFVAPDTNGSISENPDDYVGLTAEDVIYGGGAVNPNQCICSNDVINKACPLHGIGCPDCICVGNDYAKDCPVHGSLVDTDAKTGILSDIYAGVRSIADTLTDALASVGEGVYTGVKDIAATLRDMFKPSDFDLSFDGFKSIGLSDKFPFCIPFDFYDCIAVWSADASNYKLHVDVNTSFWKVKHTVDMSQFSTPIKFFRLFCIVIFSYILITRTRSLMKW